MVAVAMTSSAVAAPPNAIRVGGPSSIDESKVAIVGSKASLAGDRFEVVDTAGATVLEGTLTKARGKPAPWRKAYAADLTAITTPGTYRVVVGKLRSKPWVITDGGSDGAVGAILNYFNANRDGSEPSATHGPAHLNDATIHPAAPTRPGEHINITGGWMDAGDMLHFTQTTAFSASVLEAAALLDPANAAALESEADVGIRWLLAAHPYPDVFVAQVGDARDHDLGFRDPADDDGGALPGIATRFAYTLNPGQIGGDLGGKAATALALAFQRTGDPALLNAAREWYDAGKLSGAPAPALVKAGYPSYADRFYRATHWQDSMATGALELYRATGETSYLDEYTGFITSRDSQPNGTIGAVESFAPLGAADACGALGRPAIAPGPALDASCSLLRENGEIAVFQARKNAFGMPGFFSWGTTAQNGGTGALAALAAGIPDGPSEGCAVAAGARDYLLGRNPFGRSFVVGYGMKAARNPHHWASVFGKGLPAGAVVGGPAPLSQIRDQGFKAKSPLNSSFAAYEDSRRNYVTSEPAIDYSAASILLLAALRSHC